MKTSTKILITIGSLFVLGLGILLIIGGGIWDDRGKAVKLKNNIETKVLANESTYDKLWKTFKEQTQVTELQTEQFKEIYTDIISGRFEGDENLLVKSVIEDNPKIDTSLYKTIMNQIAADREVFNNNQKQLLDMINTYNSFIEHDAVIMATILNFEKIDPSKYIVTSERTEKAFETGKDEEIQLKSKE